LAIAVVASLSNTADARGGRRGGYGGGYSYNNGYGYNNNGYGYNGGYSGGYSQSNYAPASSECGCQCGAATAPTTANYSPATANPTPAMTGGGYSGSNTSGYRGTDVRSADLPPAIDQTDRPDRFRDLNRNSQSIHTQPQDNRTSPPAPAIRVEESDPLAPNRNDQRPSDQRINNRDNNRSDNSSASPTLPGTRANSESKRLTESGDGPGPSPVPQPPVGADAVRPSDSKK